MAPKPRAKRGRVDWVNREDEPFSCQRPVVALAIYGADTRAGIAAAKRRRVKLGRKPLRSPEQVAHARTLIGHGERPDTVAQSLNVSRRTLYRALQG